jgi:hypothetical protein
MKVGEKKRKGPVAGRRLRLLPPPGAEPEPQPGADEEEGSASISAGAPPSGLGFLMIRGGLWHIRRPTG